LLVVWLLLIGVSSWLLRRLEARLRLLAIKLHGRDEDTLTLSKKGSCQTVIPESDTLDAAKVTRLFLCSGNVYYVLLEKRRAEGRED
ncbi:hypothetical protein, partial [Klebsiella quasipneumoniae]|uniref:hypothetical protein n=1 Tax=Klebsiella quasipneumoniae TaxID=1463165 RepID=UPI00272F4B68